MSGQLSRSILCLAIAFAMAFGSLLPHATYLPSHDQLFLVAEQLAAYARADFVGLNDGSEKPLLPKKYGKIRHGLVIRPTASGRPRAPARRPGAAAAR